MQPGKITQRCASVVLTRLMLYNSRQARILMHGTVVLFLFFVFYSTPSIDQLGGFTNESESSIETRLFAAFKHGLETCALFFFGYFF